MKGIKDGLKRILARFGYRLERSREPRVRFANFANLASAYERRLNKAHGVVAPNDARAQILARLMGTPPSEAYFIVQGLAKCKHLGGDVCEFGVAQGETSALIANELLTPMDKTLHLFDSFEGLPEPSAKDQLKDDIFSLGHIDAYAGQMACPDDMVRSRLQAIGFPEERYVIHKGFIEQVLKEARTLPSKVSFAYVDFDFYEPIRLTLEFLHEVTSDGAVIIVDDYDFFSTGAKSAVDEFIERHSSIYSLDIPDTGYGHFAVLCRLGAS